MSRYLQNLIQRAKGSGGISASAPVVSARPTPLFSPEAPTPPSEVRQPVPQVVPVEPSTPSAPRYVPPVIEEISAVEAVRVLPPTSDMLPEPRTTVSTDTPPIRDAALSEPVHQRTVTPPVVEIVPQPTPEPTVTTRTAFEVSETAVEPSVRRTITPMPPRPPESMPQQAPQRERRQTQATVPSEPTAITPRPREQADLQAPPVVHAEPTPVPSRIEPRRAPADFAVPHADNPIAVRAEALVEGSATQDERAAIVPRPVGDPAPEITAASQSSVPAERQTIILPEATAPPAPVRPVKRSVEVHIGSLEVRFDAPEPPRPAPAPPAPASRPTFDDYAARRSYRETD